MCKIQKVVFFSLCSTKGVDNNNSQPLIFFFYINAIQIIILNQLYLYCLLFFVCLCFTIKKFINYLNFNEVKKTGMKPVLFYKVQWQ